MASPPIAPAPLELGALLGAQSNPRGIPEMRFLESIGDLLTAHNTNVESALQALQVRAPRRGGLHYAAGCRARGSPSALISLHHRPRAAPPPPPRAPQTMHSKYKLMEQSLTENKKRLRVQVPDIQANLDAVRMLIARAAEDADAAFPVHFALADQVHAKALVKPSGSVSLWLGAKVMLDYPYEEAQQLLEANLLAAKNKLEEVSTDLDYVRGQAITTEVNMARVFNHDVVVRRDNKRAGLAA